MQEKAKILIVAGESSGELYGSLLARYLKNDFEIIGIGGKHMVNAGVKLIGEITHTFGAFEVITHLMEIRKNMKRAENLLKNVGGVVLIDFPDFNLALAQKAKRLGKKIIYYVSPQIWAWRKGRIKKIKELVDYMAVVLPFEEEIYRNAEVPVKFVGHPMFEAMQEELGSKFEDKIMLRDRIGIKQKTVITLMPGSRPSEIKRKMPLMLNLIENFDRNKTHFIIPKAPNIEFSGDVLKQINSYGNVTVLNEQSFTALAMSDVAVITSGTSTLQATLLKIPMIVVYRMNPLSYLIGKSIIKGVKHIALPNVIADFMNEDEVRVPEFIQNLDSNNIIAAINRILYDISYRNSIINLLENIRKYFIGKKPSKEVATLCKELFY